jgi:3-dehydroquinate synthase
VIGGEAGTRLVIGEGALDQAGRVVAETLPQSPAAVIVVDEAVADRIGTRAQAGLQAAGFSVEVVSLPGGEEAKSVERLAWLWERFKELGLDRTGTVVAVGGGTILDIAGLAAATYARGVPLVNVPTTLLAMVDAGMGGKVGVNHAGVKNLAGAFHHPRVVVIDPGILASRSHTAARAGWAEVVKAALLASPLVLDVLGDGSGDGLRSHFGWLIEQAVRIKAAYVAEDPFDRAARAALNLGHTFAHAIESASGYEVSHAEAVAVGLVAAARLGSAVGLTPDGLQDRLSDLLTRLGLPIQSPAFPPEKLLSAMRGDKKRRADRSVFVVPAARGAVLLDGVDPRDALAALYPARSVVGG